MIKLFTSKTQSFGEQGEQEAVLYLKKNGFKIIDRNVPNKFGEIDIVAQKDTIFYFFEVKAGKKESGINPAENLHPTKLRKLLISVQHYCLMHHVSDYRVQGIVVMFENGTDPSFKLLDIT